MRNLINITQRHSLLHAEFAGGKALLVFPICIWKRSFRKNGCGYGLRVRWPLPALKPVRAIDESIALLCFSISLEKILETELDNTRIHACGCNLPKRAIPQRRIGISKLGMVKGIVKLRPELEGMAFTYPCVFDERNIPVKLAGTLNNTHASIAPAGATAIDPAGWRCTE